MEIEAASVAGLEACGAGWGSKLGWCARMAEAGRGSDLAPKEAVRDCSTLNRKGTMLENNNKEVYPPIGSSVPKIVITGSEIGNAPTWK
jgi:hypothetical protein